MRNALTARRSWQSEYGQFQNQPAIIRFKRDPLQYLFINNIPNISRLVSSSNIAKYSNAPQWCSTQKCCHNGQSIVESAIFLYSRDIDSIVMTYRYSSPNGNVVQYSTPCQCISRAAAAYVSLPGGSTGQAPRVLVPQSAYRLWREGVDSPTNGVSTWTHVHGLTPLVSRPHFAHNTNRIFNILSVIYTPSQSASVRLGHVCRPTCPLSSPCWVPNYGRPTCTRPPSMVTPTSTGA